ncbi:hypothetical protein [Streptomyces sp. NPDC018610]|uniref:hypothetical protein n=1 Tax=Streptomyces sp. NPDC018610 TaxID=3365049 RepID=UPI0037B161B9
MAAVVLSPYGGAGQAEIDRFPAYASLTPLDEEAQADGGPWHFRQDTADRVVLALNEPDQKQAVHVVMELAGPRRCGGITRGSVHRWPFSGCRTRGTRPARR